MKKAGKKYHFDKFVIPKGAKALVANILDNIKNDYYYRKTKKWQEAPIPPEQGREVRLN